MQEEGQTIAAFWDVFDLADDCKVSALPVTHKSSLKESQRDLDEAVLRPASCAALVGERRAQAARSSAVCSRLRC